MVRISGIILYPDVREFSYYIAIEYGISLTREETRAEEIVISSSRINKFQ